jgi:hypothetical protein
LSLFSSGPEEIVANCSIFSVSKRFLHSNAPKGLCILGPDK